MHHPGLKKLRDNLPQYYSSFKTDNILTISDEEQNLPFIYVINDASHPEFFLLSIAVDYPHSERVVEVALWANDVKKSVLAEAFYVAKNGDTYLGQDAHTQWALENAPLSDLTPPTSTRH